MNVKIATVVKWKALPLAAAIDDGYESGGKYDYFIACKGEHMKVFIGVSLVLGMLIFQSNLIIWQYKNVAAIIGLMCFIGLIIWLFFENKKRGSDPVIMINDTDLD